DGAEFLQRGRRCSLRLRGDPDIGHDDRCAHAFGAYHGLDVLARGFVSSAVDDDVNSLASKVQRDSAAYILAGAGNEGGTGYTRHGPLPDSTGILAHGRQRAAGRSAS